MGGKVVFRVLVRENGKDVGLVMGERLVFLVDETVFGVVFEVKNEDSNVVRFLLNKCPKIDMLEIAKQLSVSGVLILEFSDDGDVSISRVL